MPIYAKSNFKNLTKPNRLTFANLNLKGIKVSFKFAAHFTISPSGSVVGIIKLELFIEGDVSMMTIEVMLLRGVRLKVPFKDPFSERRDTRAQSCPP